METSKLKDLASLNWTIQGFNGCANYISVGSRSGFEDMRENLGYGYTKKVLIFRKNYVEYFYLEDDFQNIGEEFLKRFKENKGYFNEILEKDLKLRENSLKTFKELEERFNDSRKITKEEAIKLHSKAFLVHHTQIGVSHIIEGITHVLEKEILNLIKSELKIEDSKKATKIMNDLSQPIRPSFIAEEHIDLLEIINNINELNLSYLFKEKESQEIFENLPFEIQRQIKSHARKYFYYQLNYYSAKSLTIYEYIKTIKELVLESVNSNRQIEIEKSRYSKNVENMEKLKSELNLSFNLIDLLNLSIELLHWQDDRKKQILQGVYYMDLTLTKVSELFNVDLELLKRFDPDEVTLENLTNSNLEELKNRVNFYGIYYYIENGIGKFKILNQNQVEIFLNNYKKSHLVVDELHGLTASIGKAVGTVRVCKTKEDLVHFKEGEVLVASMTRPEFVLAMKKAAAIVTDEGGITCHAAIVSRELNIPCIIGTKISTKVLKNGDLIEVKANHGLVRIIKRA